MIRTLCLILGAILSCAVPLCAGTATTQPTTAPAPYSKAEIDKSIARGLEFLLKDQQPGGFWGTGLETRGTEIYSSVPGSLDSFRIGTTSLCVMALRELGETKAHDKGLEYLLTARDPRRDTGDLIYNTWAHIYLLQAMAEEMPHNPDPRIRKVAEREIQDLVRYATFKGGWNYYDFDAHTQHPSLGPTSFGTAAGLVALYEAKQAGLDVPDKLVKQSVKQLEECRLPNGVYLYGSDYKYIPRLRANLPKGAVGRTQPSNYALRLWGWDKITKLEIREGLDLFFADHVFLDMGRKRPYPHESWYQTSGYYYYFDHYYAARLFEMLDAGDKEKYAPRLVAAVLPHQEPDGSWWDYAMWDFHKPYGTAFAVMTLLRCEQR
ncbi:MAG TPA: hypothetical protein VLJ39_07125 [Tepidisphaeraceae bacterium]|nr:hypothetical protein [Tepidisphaeraceae bacterium]